MNSVEWNHSSSSFCFFLFFAFPLLAIVRLDRKKAKKRQIAPESVTVWRTAGDSVPSGGRFSLLSKPGGSVKKWADGEIEWEEEVGWKALEKRSAKR